MARFDEPVIAEKDAYITDARGLRLHIVAGTTVPRPLVEAYRQQVGGKSKAQRAPETDKAQRGPQVTKSA